MTDDHVRMNQEVQPPHADSSKATDREQLGAAQDALAQRLGGSRRRKYVRFFVAALSRIPWVGGVFSAASSFSAEKDQEKVNELHRLWLAQHEEKAAELLGTLHDIFERLDNFGDEIEERQ